MPASKIVIPPYHAEAWMVRVPAGQRTLTQLTYRCLLADRIRMMQEKATPEEVQMALRLLNQTHPELEQAGNNPAEQAALLAGLVTGSSATLADLVQQPERSGWTFPIEAEPDPTIEQAEVEEFYENMTLLDWASAVSMAASA